MESPSENPFGGKTACCFTGHRPAGLPAENSGGMAALRLRLMRAVCEAADGGVRVFWAGGAQGFDQLAAEAVLLLRESRPELRLALALPAKDQADNWPSEAKQRYNRALAAADTVWYAAERTDTGALLRRNRYLVDHADCCIAYLHRTAGGTLYTVRYALSRGIYVRNLAIPDEM